MNTYDAIKHFIIVFYGNSSLKRLSNEDWDTFFTIVELKYPDYIYSCSMYCILNEWSTYYVANKDNFTYVEDCIR